MNQFSRIDNQEGTNQKIMAKEEQPGFRAQIGRDYFQPQEAGLRDHRDLVNYPELQIVGLPEQDTS